MADDKFASHAKKVMAEINNQPDAQDILAAAKSPIAPHVSGPVVDEDNPELTIYLARHPEKLQQLNRMPEKAAKAEVGKISEQLKNGGGLKEFFRVRAEQERIKRGRR